MTKRKYVFGRNYYDKALRLKHRDLTWTSWIDEGYPWVESWSLKKKKRRILKAKRVSKADMYSIKSFMNPQ